MSDQPRLFDDDPASPSSAPTPDAEREWLRRLEATHTDARSLAAQLPQGLHFGTSSWSFPGWAGIVYSARRTESELAREGLREYAAHPLLTTVGIDRSYYAPIPLDDFRRYADQLPDGFRCCIKAPSTFTSYALGATGTPVLNQDFLSHWRLIDDLLEPCEIAFKSHTGPIVIECPPVPRGVRLDPAEFAGRLDECLTELPHDYTYAIELRDRALLTREYAAVIARHGATHTYNYWSAMPLPGAQAVTVVPERLSCDAVVIRLLLRPGTRYADQREAFRPFDRLVEPDDLMRADTVALTRQALAAGKKVYLLVNNKAEGSSPLTVAALARHLATPA